MGRQFKRNSVDYLVSAVWRLAYVVLYVIDCLVLNFNFVEDHLRAPDFFSSFVSTLCQIQSERN